MGDTDGSSRAAHGAQSQNSGNDSDGRGGFLSRLIDAFSSRDDLVDQVNGAEVRTQQPRGMINLRRMRVEDVAIPTAEIVSAPSTTSKDELAQISAKADCRESLFMRARWTHRWDLFISRTLH